MYIKPSSHQFNSINYFPVHRRLGFSECEMGHGLFNEYLRLNSKGEKNGVVKGNRGWVFLDGQNFLMASRPDGLVPSD